jgi:hypothetical protein
MEATDQWTILEHVQIISTNTPDHKSVKYIKQENKIFFSE